MEEDPGESIKAVDEGKHSSCFPTRSTSRAAKKAMSKIAAPCRRPPQSTAERLPSASVQHIRQQPGEAALSQVLPQHIQPKVKVCRGGRTMKGNILSSIFTYTKEHVVYFSLA